MGGIIANPLRVSNAGTTVLVVAAGADWTEAGRFRDAKTWHAYVRETCAAYERELSALFKKIVNEKHK